MCDEYIEAAEHGYRFLKEKMWDTDNGAFYWEVDATGNEKLKPRKHLYGQSFALYAISEYFLATGRQDVLDFAIRFFGLLEEKSHDKMYGGYIEFFNEDWTPVPAGESSYMGAPADSLTKVWWVEAEAVVSALYMHRFSGDPQYLDIFQQTYDYIEKQLVDFEHGE